MRHLILTLFLISFHALPSECQFLKKAAEYLNPNIFIKASKKQYRLIGKKELSLKFKTRAEARDYVYNFPAFKKFDIPHPNKRTWKKYYSKLESSPLYQKRTGFEYHGPKATGRVRIDVDQNGVGHYNLEITTKIPKKETYKLAAEFSRCDGKPCNVEAIMKIVEKIN